MNEEQQHIDAMLMERVRQGDESAFKVIVEDHQRDIFNLCMQYLGDRQDAEEIAQDVFIKLFKIADTYEPRAKLSTFLYRIAVNLSLNRIRDRKRKRLVSLDFLEVKRDGPLWRSQDQPDEIMEQSERTELVRKAIQSLPANQKTAVLLNRFQGLSYEEIAEVMKCSVSAVESRLFRARQNLKRKLISFSGM